MTQENFEHEFLIRLAAVWLACRLDVMGGISGHPMHHPVTNFRSLAWPMLGCSDYRHEMRLLCDEVRDGAKSR